MLGGLGAATNYAARCGPCDCASPPNRPPLHRLLSFDKPRVLLLKPRTTCHGTVGLVPAIARITPCRQRLDREVVADDHSGNLQSPEHNMNHFSDLIVDSHTTSGVIVHGYLGAATNHAASLVHVIVLVRQTIPRRTQGACHRSSGRFGA